MKSFTIALILTVAFAAYGYAAPAEPAPVSNYEPLIKEINKIPKSIPGSAPYIEILDKDIEAQKEAAESGNKAEMAASVRKGAEDTKTGSPSVKSNDNLYKLASEQAPAALNALGDGFDNGTKTAADENDLMGEFEKLVAQYIG